MARTKRCAASGEKSSIPDASSVRFRNACGLGIEKQRCDFTKIFLCGPNTERPGEGSGPPPPVQECCCGPPARATVSAHVDNTGIRKKWTAQFANGVEGRSTSGNGLDRGRSVPECEPFEALRRRTGIRARARAARPSGIVRCAAQSIVSVWDGLCLRSQRARTLLSSFAGFAVVPAEVVLARLQSGLPCVKPVSQVGSSGCSPGQTHRI